MGFYVQDDYWEAVEDLSDGEQDAFMGAIARLYFTGEVKPPKQKNARRVFIMAKERVVKAKQKADQKSNSRMATNAETNRATNRATNAETDCAQNAPTCLIESERERESKRETYDPDTKTDCKSTKPKSGNGGFQPPTPSQVEEYASDYKKSKGWKTPFDAEDFCDFYASKNWLVGKAKMSDWKAAVRRWIRENHDKESKGGGKNDCFLSPEYRR